MTAIRSCALLLIVAAAACRDPKPLPPAAGAAARDDFGSVIDLTKRPRRIVSLNPTTTQLLFAIGASSRLVGRSQYDTSPDSAKLIPSVGPALRPNIEAVLAVHPDLVVLYASADNQPAVDRLRQAGIVTVGFKIDSIAQFARDTRLLGRLTGDSARAATLVDSIEATLARVRAATASLPKPSILIHAWDKPIIAIGGGSFMSELLDIAGARNVYADMATPSVTVTMEDVFRRNPDIVLAAPTAIPNLRASASWRTLPAVRDGRLFAYDTLLVSNPATQLGAAAVSLANLLHPGAVR